MAIGHRSWLRASWMAAGVSMAFPLVCQVAHAQSCGTKQAYCWSILPPTPPLPQPRKAGYAHVNGIKLWYAIFGHGSPVVMLHGGLANSDYFGHQIPALDKQYEVITVDSRGQGRSGMSSQPITYTLMASDVVGLMNHLHLQKAAVVGWSDGAIIGLELAVHYPSRVSRLFAFAANTTPSGVDDNFINNSPVWKQYIARTEQEYKTSSPTPDGYSKLLKNITHMWATEPDLTAAELQKITVPTWIVDGDHDRAIRRSNDDFMFHHIPGAEELILPGVSHFAFLQRPKEFDAAILHFLTWKPSY